jgi:hypothetical protein
MTISSVGPNAWNWSVSQQNPPRSNTDNPVGGMQPPQHQPPRPGASPTGVGDSAVTRAVSGTANPFQTLTSDLQALLTQYQSGTSDRTAGSSTNAAGGPTSTPSAGDAVQNLLDSLSSTPGQDPVSGSLPGTSNASTGSAQATDSASTDGPHATHHHHHSRPERTGVDAASGPSAQAGTSTGLAADGSSATNRSANIASATGSPSVPALAAQVVKALHAYAGGGSIA